LLPEIFSGTLPFSAPGAASRGFGQELKHVRNQSSSFHLLGGVAKILAKALSFATKFCEPPVRGKRTTLTRFAELRIFAKRDRLVNQSKTGSSQLADYQAFPCSVYNLGGHSS